jgi:hypothetical protein
MKKCLFLLLLVGISASVFSNNHQFGIKGGMHFSSLQSDLTTEINNLSVTALSDRYTGYHLGLVGSFVYPGFFIQPEILWVGTGRDMVLTFPDQIQTSEYYIQKFQHVSIPVLMGMKVGPVKIGIGPVFSALLTQRNDSIYPQNIRHRLNRTSLGYQIGAGLQLGGLLLELRHEASLSRFGDGVSIGGIPFDLDMRPRQIILSVGLLF